MPLTPFEKTVWGRVGLHQVKRLDVPAKFKWMGEHSIHALSKLIKRNEKFEFIYIDGNHRFDDVLVDFYLCDQLMLPGRLLAFDDMWMPSVRTVVSFVLTNRHYKIVAQPIGNMMVLQKIAEDDRDWDHFKQFIVGLPKRNQVILATLSAHLSGRDGILRRIGRFFGIGA